MTDSAILKDDLQWISAADLPWDKLRGSTVLVTGATGLIGMTTVHALIAADKEHDLGLHVLALVRSREKAERVLGNEKENPALSFIEGTMEALPALPDKIDYWIHTACPTASAFMTAHPVEVIRTSVEGTCGLLEEARKRSISGFVFLSSMEAFGEVNTEDLLDEKTLGNVDLSPFPQNKMIYLIWR